MNTLSKKLKANDLKNIPGVGRNMERHFFDTGIFSIADLKGKDPEELYIRNCLVNGTRVDRCVLYVFRMAVYYADSETHEPEKLKWWYWKDQSSLQHDTPLSCYL